MTQSKRRFMDTVRTLHGLCGVFLAGLVLALSISGSLLIFKEDYLKLVEPAARGAADMSDAKLVQVLQSAETLFAKGDVRAVAFARPDFGLNKVYLSDGRAAYLSAEGELVDQWKKNGRVEDWVFDLHHYLLAGDIGKTVAGFSGLALICMVITGCIAFWPARHAFRLGLRLRGWKCLYLKLTHRNLGIIMALPILIITITGSGIVFSKTTKTFLSATLGVSAPNAERVVQVSSKQNTDWGILLAAAHQTFPESTPRIVSFPSGDSPPQLRIRQLDEWHPNGLTRLTLKDSKEQLVMTSDALNLSRGNQVFNAFYPIHSAAIGGRLYDLLLLLVGLSFAFLSLIGATSYFRKFVKPRRV